MHCNKNLRTGSHKNIRRVYSRIQPHPLRCPLFIINHPRIIYLCLFVFNQHPHPRTTSLTPSQLLQFFFGHTCGMVRILRSIKFLYFSCYRRYEKGSQFIATGVGEACNIFFITKLLYPLNSQVFIAAGVVM